MKKWRIDEIFFIVVILQWLLLRTTWSFLVMLISVCIIISFYKRDNPEYDDSNKSEVKAINKKEIIGLSLILLGAIGISVFVIMRLLS